MIALLRTIADFAYVVISMIVLFPIAVALFALSALGLKKPMSIAIHKVAQGWARLLIRCTGCNVSVKGRENVPREGALCFVSNHGSIFDIALLLAFAGRPFGFIAKKELLLIPFLNIWILLLGGLFIDRKNARKAINTINTGIKQIKGGGAMLIFPEGTRSRGKGLLPFHPGSFKLATQSKAAIVAVAIAGSYDVFEKTYRAAAVPVSMTFAPPLLTTDLPPEGRRQALSDRVYAIIAAALETTT
jgi:1-acyl-sn-glycerol-3-phosphate acyltransferase